MIVAVSMNTFLTQFKLEAYREEIETRTQIEVDVKMRYPEDVEIAKSRMEIKVKASKEIVMK